MKDFISSQAIWVLISLLIFAITAIIQLFYYLFLFSKALRKSDDLNRRIKKYPAVSVVICAQNEGDNLQKKLPFFLDQNYPEFEVVVVNDRSDDNTKEILDQFSRKYSHLKISNIQGEPILVRGKKLALTLGIKSAKYDILLLSDADCEPAGPDWIRYMMRNYTEKTEMVLGIGLYKHRKGMLNVLIRFEAAFIAIQYISLARFSRAYMGVGRNLSYKKELFFKNKGFASHLKLESGDDDLFVNEISNRGNTAIETHPGSFTYSEPEISFRRWLKQKKRHLTTSRYYQTSTKGWLGLEYLSRMLLFVSFILLLLFTPLIYPVIMAFSGILLIKGIILKLAFDRLNEKFLFLWAILLEPLTPWLYGFLHILNFIERKRSRWN